MARETDRARDMAGYAAAAARIWARFLDARRGVDAERPACECEECGYRASPPAVAEVPR